MEYSRNISNYLHRFVQINYFNNGYNYNVFGKIIDHTPLKLVLRLNDEMDINIYFKNIIEMV